MIQLLTPTSPLVALFEQHDRRRDYAEISPVGQIQALWTDFLGSRKELSDQECYTFFEPLLRRNLECEQAENGSGSRFQEGLAKAVNVAREKVSHLIKQVLEKKECPTKLELDQVDYADCILKKVSSRSESDLYNFAIYLPAGAKLPRSMGLVSQEKIAKRIEEIVKESPFDGLNADAIFKIGGLVNLLSPDQRISLLPKLDASCYQYVAAMFGVSIQSKPPQATPQEDSPRSSIGSLSSQITIEESESN